jgi:hypothetical protein
LLKIYLSQIGTSVFGNVFRLDRQELEYKKKMLSNPKINIWAQKIIRSNGKELYVMGFSE